MDIVADANLAMLDETFARHGRITRLPGRELTASDVRHADVLLLRSVTRADRSLLAGSRVRFVGTATIGTDHLDIPWLEANGIAWACAPGCNADAAAQYALAMAWAACQRRGMDLLGSSAGIVGRGNVGSRLQKLLQTLDIPAVACDPPLQDAGVQGLSSLEEALEQPLVSLHVPLTQAGPYATVRMLRTENLARLPDGALLLNTSRGDVIDGAALLGEIGAGRIQAALDVWPGEPDVDLHLVDRCTVATPHVAGYSVEGKRNGTLMIYRAFCAWAGIEAPQAAPRQARRAPADAETLLEALAEAARGVAADDAAMRDALSRNEDTGQAFDRLRKSYRLRHDFGAVIV